MGKFNLMSMTPDRIKRAADPTPIPTLPKVTLLFNTKNNFLLLHADPDTCILQNGNTKMDGVDDAPIEAEARSLLEKRKQAEVPPTWNGGNHS